MPKIMLVNGSASALGNDAPGSVESLSSQIVIPSDAKSVFISIKVRYSETRPHFGRLVTNILTAFEKVVPSSLKPIRAILATITHDQSDGVVITYGSGTDIIGG